MGNLVVLDEDTGEILHDLTGYHIVKDKSDFSLINFKESSDDFVKVFQDAIPVIYQALNSSEISFFFFCTQYLSYRDCALREGGHGNGKLLTPKDLFDCNGLSSDRGYHILSKLYKCNLADRISVDYTDRKAIVLNPFCVFRGSEILVKVYNHFILKQKKGVSE